MAVDPGVTPPTGEYGREDRVRKRPEYRSVYANARPIYTSKLVFYALLGDGPRPRLGVTVPKPTGNSVARNRLKRLIREAFRRSRSSFPPGCILIVNAKRQAASLTLDDVLESFRRAAGEVRTGGSSP